VILTRPDSIFAQMKNRASGVPRSLRQILFYSLLVKLALAALLPLTSDESYYWVWSHAMQLSFFDHPPVVAWLFWLSQPFENFGGAVRWAGVLMSQGTLFIWLMILRPYFSDEKLEIWLWLSLLSPLFGAGGLLITPDIPLLFFWSLTLLLFVNWIKHPTVIRSCLVGLFCGLGLSSKYMMVLGPFFLFLGCVFIKDWRRAMLKGWFWILLGVIAGSSPVWIWNYLNDFASFRFQAEHGLGRAWKPNWTYEYILGQIGLIFPSVLFFAIRGTKKAPTWLWLVAWGPLVFFLTTTFKGYVEVNWPIVAYPAVFALAVFGINQSAKVLRGTYYFWAFVLAAMFFLIITRWSPTGEPIKTKEFFEFEVLTPVAKDHSPLFARSYQMAAKLSFDLKRPIPKLRGLNRRDYYDFIQASMPTTDRFFLLAQRDDRFPPTYVEQGYKVVSKTDVPNSSVFQLWEIAK
jgi:4-amino-4-deoxy-L-arabinose transferase-like glycosyltransferase